MTSTEPYRGQVTNGQEKVVSDGGASNDCKTLPLTLFMMT